MLTLIEVNLQARCRPNNSCATSRLQVISWHWLAAQIHGRFNQVNHFYVLLKVYQVNFRNFEFMSVGFFLDFWKNLVLLLGTISGGFWEAWFCVNCCYRGFDFSDFYWPVSCLGLRISCRWIPGRLDWSKPLHSPYLILSVLYVFNALSHRPSSVSNLQINPCFII